MSGFPASSLPTLEWRDPRSWAPSLLAFQASLPFLASCSHDASGPFLDLEAEGLHQTFPHHLHHPKLEVDQYPWHERSHSSRAPQGNWPHSRARIRNDPGPSQRDVARRADGSSPSSWPILGPCLMPNQLRALATPPEPKRLGEELASSARSWLLSPFLHTVLSASSSRPVVPRWRHWLLCLWLRPLRWPSGLSQTSSHTARDWTAWSLGLLGS